MATTANSTNLADSLKRVYNKDKVRNSAELRQPFLSMIKKEKGPGGSVYAFNVRASDGGGRSRTFSTAQSTSTPPAGKQFLVTYTTNFAHAQISNLLIAQSRGQEAAFFNAQIGIIDAKLNKLGKDIERSLFRGTTGSIGTIGASSSGSTLYFANVDDCVNVEVDDVLVFSSTDGGAVGSSLTVTAKNAETGALTMSATLASVSASAGNYVYHSGDLNASACGLAGWVPATAPTAGDSHFGVDRTSNITAYAGQRLTATGTIEEALLQASVMNSINASTPADTVFMHPQDFRKLAQSLGSRLVYNDMKVGSNANWGMRSITIDGSNGAMKVVSAPLCQVGTSWVLPIEVMKLVYLDESVPVLDKCDGLSSLRLSSDDGLELRFKAYYAVICEEPASVVRVTLPA